jgi:FkbM family methyltransferase
MGYDISRFNPESHPIARRRKLFDSYGIDLILDVGANIGQFAHQMRTDLGYTGKIISFEPLSSAFELLRNKASGDPKWEVINFALGEVSTMAEINIAGNSYSSSLLNMLPSHTIIAPKSRYIGREVIEIRTLDSIINDLCTPENHIYLKIDTQGFESKVIEGAEQSLIRIGTIQLEMSLTPLYEEELLFGELHNILSNKGYNLVSIEPGFTDPRSGHLLQIDGIYHRF